MADVELLDLGNARNRLDVAHREAVTGVDGEAELHAEARRRFQGLQRLGVVRMMRVAAGMKLHGDGAECARRLHGALVGIDEKARPDPRRIHLTDAVTNA